MDVDEEGSKVEAGADGAAKLNDESPWKGGGLVLDDELSDDQFDAFSCDEGEDEDTMPEAY